MNKGRAEIFTDVKEITSENLILVLQKAMGDFRSVSDECSFLEKYEKGEQPLKRKKKYRSDINCECVDNIANEVVEFKLGFNWGNPITFVQKEEEDSKEFDKALAISLLNKNYDEASIKKKTQQLAYYVETDGIGFVLVDINTEWQDGDSFFTIDVLDPKCTFVVKSSRYVDHRPMLGVTFRKDDNGNYYFTCFTRENRYEVLNMVKVVSENNKEDVNEWKEDERSGEKNPLGMIPIIEYIRSHDRMGCFERQISEMDNLNLLISDFTNDVEQNTQAIWHTNDVEFPKELVTDANGKVEEKETTPKTNDWLQTYTSQDGKTPFVKPLAIDYDYEGMLNNIASRRALILQKCNVPQRNDNSGGSTGVAMSDATGWSAAETSACKEQNIVEGCKMDEVRVALAAIKKSPNVPADSPLLKLRPSDLQPNIKRQKTYELTVKTNAICALLAKGFSLEDCVNTIPMFEDPNQVVVRSGEGVKAYQESNVFKTEKQIEKETEEKRPFPDYSDQEENSPNIGGMGTSK